jgi:hypothetical protein
VKQKLPHAAAKFVLETGQFLAILPQEQLLTHQRAKTKEWEWERTKALEGGMRTRVRKRGGQASKEKDEKEEGEDIFRQR